MSDKPEKMAIGGELIIPVAGLLFTLYYFSTIINSPWTAQVSAFFVGAVLIFLIAIFFIKSALAVKRGEANLRMDSLLSPRSLVPKRLALAVKRGEANLRMDSLLSPRSLVPKRLALLGLIVLVEWGGFTLTVFAFLTLAMLLLTGGRNKRFIVLLCAGLALGGYLLFILAFDTRFPDGPFEQLMEQVF